MPITGAGGIAQGGTGTLVLTNLNPGFDGGALITAGTLNILADSVLGTAPTSPTTNILFAGSGTLQFADNFDLDLNRIIVITNALSFVNMNTNWFIFTATNGLASGRHSYTLLNANGGYGGSSLDTGGGTNYTTFLGYNELTAYLWLDSASQSLKLTVVPEPDALLLVAGGIGLLVLMRRRRSA
jgi:autotransporter-associated beta strand protein